MTSRYRILFLGKSLQHTQFNLQNQKSFRNWGHFFLFGGIQSFKDSRTSIFISIVWIVSFPYPTPSFTFQYKNAVTFLL